MQVSRYWKSFLDTGKVEDYLAYKEVQTKQEKDRVDAKERPLGTWEEHKEKDICRNTLQ